MLDPSDTILIVDDEPMLRELLEVWIRRSHSGTVHSVESAEEAIQMLQAWPIAVAFCDQMMPGAGGDWLIAQIRERFPTVAVIMATATQPTAPLQSGVVGHLVKPFSGAMVREALANGLAWHHAAQRPGSR